MPDGAAHERERQPVLDAAGRRALAAQLARRIPAKGKRARRVQRRGEEDVHALWRRAASTWWAKPPRPGTRAYSANRERSSFDQRLVPGSSRRRYVADHATPSSGEIESAPFTKRVSVSVTEPPTRLSASHPGQTAARAVSGIVA